MNTLRTQLSLIGVIVVGWTHAAFAEVRMVDHPVVVVPWVAWSVVAG